MKFKNYEDWKKSDLEIVVKAIKTLGGGEITKKDTKLFAPYVSHDASKDKNSPSSVLLPVLM